MYMLVAIISEKSPEVFSYYKNNFRFLPVCKRTLILTRSNSDVSVTCEIGRDLFPFWQIACRDTRGLGQQWCLVSNIFLFKGDRESTGNSFVVQVLDDLPCPPCVWTKSCWASSLHNCACAGSGAQSHFLHTQSKRSKRVTKVKNVLKQLKGYGYWSKSCQFHRNTVELKSCRTLSWISPSLYLQENVNGLPCHAAGPRQIQD